MKGTETSASEPLKTCRKDLGDVKTGGSFVIPGAVREESVYCPHGVRHGGGVTVLWASVWNVGTGRSAAKGEPQVGAVPMSGRVLRRSTGAESFVVERKGL